MRSEIAKKISDETPQEVKDYVKSYGEMVVKINDLESQLEAKDKEIAELKCDKERLSKACNYIQSSRNELDQQITDLKAEKLKADQDIIDLQRLLADRARDLENTKAEIERYKELILTLKMD